MSNPCIQLGSLESQLNCARAEVERRVRAGQFAGVEAMRGNYPEIWADPEAALELIYTEFVARSECGQAQSHDEWIRRFPEHRDRLERLFGIYELMTCGDTNAGPATDTLHQNGHVPVGGEPEGHAAGYTILNEIGRGGAAIVYRAKQHSLNREVAVKVLRCGSWSRDQDAKLLRREAELAAKLQHPNIVQVFEVGEWNGMPFLAMELVPGHGLNSLLSQHQRQGTLGITATRAAELVEMIARAMSYAHDHGVVHRDLKPANVLVGSWQWAVGSDQAGGLPPTIKIADFGLAIQCETSVAVTQTYSVAGTPCYMAPEQAEARNSDIGVCSDIYAMGAILYELLTARPPFQGATIVETLDMVRMNEPVSPRTIRPQVPRDLETICLKCLNKSPNKRYATASALAEDLRRFLDGKPIVARPVSALEHGYKWVNRYPVISALSLALFASLVAGSVVQTSRYRESESARQKEKDLHQEIQANLAGKLVASARALWNSGQPAEARPLLKECPESMRNAEWKRLYDLCHAEIASWSSTEFVGDSLAVSPDGGRLAMHCKGPERRIQVINAQDGQPIGKMETPLAMYQLEFTSDGQRLVILQQARDSTKANARTGTNLLDAVKSGTTGKVSDAATEVVIWHLAQPAATHRWSVADRGPAAISGDGKRIAARHGKQLGVWDSMTGELIAELPSQVGPTARYALAWDSHGKALAVRLATEIQIWDVDTKQQTRTIEVNAIDMSSIEKVMPMAASMSDPVFLRPDAWIVYANGAKPLATTGGTLPTIRMLYGWNIATGREEFQFASKGFSPRLSASLDGRMMAIVSNQDIELHDAQNGRHHATLRGHTESIHILRFSPDGHRLYSIAGDKTLKTWDISPWCK